MKGRLKKNLIKGLNVNGNWVEDLALIKKEVLSFFKGHFRERIECWPTFFSDKFAKLSSAQVLALEAPFTDEEIKHAVWDCEGSKVSGLDGYSFSFLRIHWEILKTEVTAFLREFERNAHFAKGCNPTFLTLIAKVTDPLPDFQPISLVNCQYKIIAKLLAE